MDNTMKKTIAVIWIGFTWFMIVIAMNMFYENFFYLIIYGLLEAVKGAIESVMVLAVLIWINSLALLSFLKKNECPHCKALFTVEKEEVQRLGEESISVLVETKRRNNQGEVIGTQEQYIPGTRVRYKTFYLCEKCGSRQYENWFKDYSNT